MSRFAYVNGAYVPHGQAQVHVEDRGYQFSDGVYEVSAVWGGRVIDEDLHLDRLERSLAELRIDMPVPRSVIKVTTAETLRKNRINDGIIYLQITRGVAPRDHAFPHDPVGSIVMTARASKWPDIATDTGAEVATVVDIRWDRRDIKSVSLLANILAKQEARERGAYEAWLIDKDGGVYEGSSTNAWMVDDAGRLITRELSNDILQGITRTTVIRLAREHGFEVIERPFSVDEAKSAPEAFLTSTTSFIKGVVSIDGHKVGDGKPGPVTRRLQQIYLDYCRGPGANA
ncbi:MAG: D-amino-acid transaminase [Rhodospirillaceae bacterium]|jgi:D-alanine transaminase|nr:D-amino-acid transaminase [Rhodospirillaceae bacterium]